MMKKLIYICTLFLFIPLISRSQLTIDSFATEQNFTQDSVTEGTNINFNVEVSYASSIPFTGTVYIVSGVDSSSGVLSIDTVGSLNVSNLMNSTISVPFHDIANSQNGYRKGGDIIVIWPAASGLLPLDTFELNIWVLPAPQLISTGINDKRIYDEFSIYPNPLSNELSIKNSSERTIKNIKIMDFSGKVIYNQTKNQKIDVSNLIQGNYLLEIELENNLRLVYQLTKAN